MSLVEVDNVTHRYSAAVARPVLDRVSLTVDDKEVVSVVGESGCGKTTLGKMIAGFVRPSAGQVRYRGRDVWGIRGDEAKSWRLAVQLVHQDPYGSLNPGLTIGATLGPGLVHNKLVRRGELRQHLLDVLRQVGLDATPEFLRRYPHQLSGGQRQRVAIARAISVQPQLLVADEVTSMLDVSMRVAILDLLRAFSREHGVACLFISHDLGVVRYFSQGGRTLVMFYGVVVEEGPTEDVILHPAHPYTYMLLQAVPVPNPGLARERASARTPEQSQGEPSESGCVFANRCPFAEPECRATRPTLAELRPGHRAACYFPERVPSISDPGGSLPDDGQLGSPFREHRADPVSNVAAGPPGGSLQS